MIVIIPVLVLFAVIFLFVILPNLVQKKSERRYKALIEHLGLSYVDYDATDKTVIYTNLSSCDLKKQPATKLELDTLGKMMNQNNATIMECWHALEKFLGVEIERIEAGVVYNKTKK